MSKNILVTGGAGYIGSACTKVLLDLGYKVVVIDNLSSGDKKYVDSRAEFIEGDILNKDVLARAFGAREFDTVVHFAALKSVEHSEQNPTEYFRNNIGGTINLLSAMEEYGVGEMVFSSSAAVYAPNDGTPFVESDKIGAINVYGNCKVVEEVLITELARTGKLRKYVILRYFNVAGDSGLKYIDTAPENVFPILASCISSGERDMVGERGGQKEFKIFGTDYDTRDGTCVRDYIHLSDLVDAHIKALEHKDSGIWNLGTSQGTSVLELASVFEEVSGKKLNTKKNNRRAGDPAVVLANASSAVEDLGWSTKKTLKEMVESTLATYLK